jgi:hypothetical protein
VTGAALSCRRARAEDLSAIVRMLADDPLGAKRERYEEPVPEIYARAFHAIEADPSNELVVAVQDERVIGVLQLTFIPSLTYQGGLARPCRGRARGPPGALTGGGEGALRVGDRASPGARLCNDPAHHGQEPPGRQALL